VFGYGLHADATFWLNWLHDVVFTLPLDAVTKRWKDDARIVFVKARAAIARWERAR